MAKRIVPTDCWGAIIDVQEFFIAQAGKHLTSQDQGEHAELRAAAWLFQDSDGGDPGAAARVQGTAAEGDRKANERAAAVFEKDFFDLTKEKKIRDHIKRLKKKQAIVAGCETDVCVLQSCLGLLDLGYEVYVVEDLLFSSARNVDAAIARMKAEGAVFLTYKTLYLRADRERGRQFT